ncbi:MFS transporter [Streptosporangium sp. NBC_01639]|uniref:MFS transporter n=1 Tax=Streptosporangium sp. NBC_01639 TaxID=2975948 RepID=UPI003865C0F5|nr:MFS transporter [Streptosporangium sp. NBC_01639]
MTSSTTADSGARTSSGTANALVGGTVGNFVEWFDWSVYGFFAPYFASQFFPGGGTTATLSTLLVFAISFFMRPVGAAVLGVYADRRGRRHGMTLTILLMAAGSLLIALAPTYGAVGWLAPAILIAGRLLQGFSTGGEFGTSASFLVEWAKPGRRAFAGSFQQVSVVLGILCASLSATVLTRTLDDDAMSSWGWRVPFVLGAVIGLIGMYIRRRLTEPEAFRRLEQSGRQEQRPLGAMAAGHRRAAWFVFGISIAGSVITYMWLTYLPTYAVLTQHAKEADAQLANTIALAFFVVVLPFAALLSDRFGRRPTMLVYAGAFVILPFPLLSMLDGSFGSVLLVSLVGMAFLSLNHSNLATVFAELFPPQVRTIGIALPYAISNAIFGGTAPSVMQFFGSRDNLWAVPLYVSVCALVTGLFFYFMRETKTVDTHNVEMRA